MARDIKELLKKVKLIELKSKRILQSSFLGNYHSVFKGKGIEFSEVREYAYGDDIRAIDWNVTSRMDKPYIKVNHEERELTVWLLVDISKSMLFSTQRDSKIDIIAELAAIISMSVIRQSDKVGLILFSDKIQKVIPPKKGQRQALLILRSILAAELASQSKTDIAALLEYFNKVEKKRSVAVLISDFWSSNFHFELGVTLARHQLIPIWIKDPCEENFPKIPFIPIVDIETNAWRMSPYTRYSRLTVNQSLNNSFEYLTAMFSKHGLKPLMLKTDSDYLKTFMNYFK